MAPRERVLEGAHVHIVMTINSSMVKNCATRVTLYGRSHSGRVLMVYSTATNQNGLS